MPTVDPNVTQTFTTLLTAIKVIYIMTYVCIIVIFTISIINRVQWTQPSILITTQSLHERQCTTELNILIIIVKDQQFVL